MKRPVKRKSHFKIKVTRRDLARAELKKLTQYMRASFHSPQGLKMGIIESMTIYRSKSVRSLANISNFAGSMRARRRLIVRAKMHSAVVGETRPRIDIAPVTGSRRRKNRSVLKTRLKDQQTIMTNMNTELEAARERHLKLPRGFGDIDTELFSAPISRGYAIDVDTIAARQQVKSEIKDGTRPMPTPEEMDAMQRRGSPHFSFRGVINSIKNDPSSISTMEQNLRTRRKVIENLDKGMPLTEAYKDAIGANGKITSIEEPAKEYKYGVELNMNMSAMPQVQEDEIFINQRQADTLGEVKKSLEDKNPLPITRGHYGDLMAASQYPGMRRIADELFKNGVEFIEASDPRAKLADYSVCFMYPHTITALDISKDTTQSEIDKFKPFDDIANWPSLEDQLQQLRLNSLKHLDPQNVVNSVQKWMDGDNNKEEGNPNNEDQD
jgi:hypothetical protein